MTIFTAILASLALMGSGATAPLDQAPPKPEFVPVAVTDNASDVGPDKSEAVRKPKVIGRVVTVTAYTSEPRQTDDTPCISADNSDICVKYAAGEKICATNDHPMHAKLHIEGYGECTVRDRMNTRYTGTGRVDIYLGMDTPAARQWGARHVAVSRL
jgi:3D (Asp-Asp-Asp) domain-containing protein